MRSDRLLPGSIRGAKKNETCHQSRGASELPKRKIREGSQAVGSQAGEHLKLAIGHVETKLEQLDTRSRNESTEDSERARFDKTLYLEVSAGDRQ